MTIKRRMAFTCMVSGEPTKLDRFPNTPVHSATHRIQLLHSRGRGVNKARTVVMGRPCKQILYIYLKPIVSLNIGIVCSAWTVSSRRFIHTLPNLAHSFSY